VTQADYRPGCNSYRHHRFRREKFSKNEFSENTSQKFQTSERWSDIDLLSTERHELKNIILDDFVDEFDIRHDNRRLKLHRVHVDMKV